MNSFLLLFSIFLVVGCTSSDGQKQEQMIKNSDTCFYLLTVPPDMDMPKTSPFDTTIVRSANCNTHILRLQSWGTSTRYTLVSSAYERSSSFLSGEEGTMDITDLPPDSYYMSLSACGNGGGFNLSIK